MKKLLKFILSLIFFMLMARVHAYEIYYSEWSSEYPNDVGRKIIESEDRYLWYREIKTDERYLVKEEIGNREVDYDDYIFSERIDNGFEQPKKLKERVIEVEPRNKYYNVNELSGIIIENLSSNSYVSEIEIFDKNNNKIELDNNNEEVLFDSDLTNYVNLKNKTYINFKNITSLDNLDIKIYCKPDINAYIEFSLVAKDGFRVYRGRYRFTGNTIEIRKEDLIESDFKTTNNYFYIDKLYKTYLLEREEVDGYLKECSGCIRIDDSKKTFYRYIKNDYVIYSQNGEILEDDSSCIKTFCRIEYLEYKEDKPKVVKVINPKTYDGVEKYYYLLIISVLFSLLVLFHKKIILFLSNRFKYVKKSINM